MYQTDTKAYSCLRVAPFMDTEQLPVEFIIVQRLPSPRLTGGNGVTVGCFKYDINIQIDVWITVVVVVGFFLLLFHYACSALFSSHIHCKSISDIKQSRNLRTKIAVILKWKLCFALQSVCLYC